jgi:hypothetical protein
MTDTRTVRDIEALLAAPFPAHEIEWRANHFFKDGDELKVFLLAFVTARATMDRFDEVFGIDGWTDAYAKWGEKGVLCTISARMPDGTWNSKTDGADDTNIESTKGGISDAYKRTGYKWTVGRYLYRLDKSTMLVREKWFDGSIYVSDEKKGFRGHCAVPTLPAWALPGGSGRPPVKATGGGTKTGTAQATGTAQRAPAPPVALPQGATQTSGANSAAVTWQAVSEAASHHKVGTKELLALAGVDSWDKVKAFSPDRLEALIALIKRDRAA